MLRSYLYDSLLISVLEVINKEVSRAIKGGEKMTKAGYIGQPVRPDHFNLGLTCVEDSTVFIMCLTGLSPVLASSQIFGIHFTVWHTINTEEGMMLFCCDFIYVLPATIPRDICARIISLWCILFCHLGPPFPNTFI